VLTIDVDKAIVSQVFPFRWPDNSWRAVVVAKKSWRIQPHGLEAIQEYPTPIFFTDQYYEDDPANSIRYASDMVPYKPNIDVVVIADAHAPANRAITSMNVSLRGGAINKSLQVLGERHWIEGLLTTSASRPQKFAQVPLRYEYAFGGLDRHSSIPHPDNPHGCAYISKLFAGKKVAGNSLPRIFYADDEAYSINKNTRVAGLGFLGASHRSRTAYLGTYDKHWQETRSPELATDFNFAYYNSAPVDQQAPLGSFSGQSIELRGMSAAVAITTIQLPGNNLSLEIGREIATPMLMDTVVIDIPRCLVYQVWRQHLPLQTPDITAVPDLKFYSSSVKKNKMGIAEN